MINNVQTTKDQWQRYMKMFSQESDRACVILTVSFLDELLTICLRMRLVATPTSVDSLFEGGNAPFSSFSSKIDVAYRLGIISNRFCRDIHLVRKIRNDFAHNIEGCDFTDQKVHNRVRELRNAFSELIDIYRTQEAAKLYQSGDRGDFQFCCSWMIDYLYKFSRASRPLEEASLEWAYDRQKMIERKLQDAPESA